jgi:hypothetical protein
MLLLNNIYIYSPNRFPSHGGFYIGIFICQRKPTKHAQETLVKTMGRDMGDSHHFTDQRISYSHGKWPIYRWFTY